MAVDADPNAMIVEDLGVRLEKLRYWQWIEALVFSCHGTKAQD
jgi:hypothetical protein